MTTPDIDSLSTYGGAKVNMYPVEDTTTDRDAGDANKMYTSCAAMTHTSVRAMVVFTAASTSAGIVIVLHDSHWGSGSAVIPVITHVATGHFQLQWPATVVDELGVTHPVAIRTVEAKIEGSVKYGVQSNPTSRFGNLADVYVWDASGNPSDAVGVNIDVFAR